MLILRQTPDGLNVECGAAVFSWDFRRGGQLCGIEAKAPAGARPLLDGLGPDLTLETDAGTMAASRSPVEVEFLKQDAEEIVFVTRGRLGDAFRLEQRYEVYPEGAVFCGFLLEMEKDRRVTARGARLRFALDIASAKNVRVGYGTRDPYPKQDVSCIHVLNDHRINLPREESFQADHLLPMVGLNLGWNEARYYSNRVEFVIEDSTSIGNGLLGRRGTAGGPRDGKWELCWQLSDGAELTAPFFYRNRWAVVIGRGRTEAGAQADPAVRNNALAARICHVMYPYVRKGERWPWCSVPMRQTFYQDVQVSKGNPPVERVDEAAALGADLLILHQFWMRNGGSNGEPMADYIPYDPAWLKAFVDRAHGRGMRVAFYMRGIEQYAAYSDFFERFLRKDWDGLYIDWASPFTLGFAKSSGLHCSAHNYFMFIRHLRQRIGEGGFMIGHIGIPTAMALAGFDALIAGEFSVMHGGLLGGPEISASYSILGSIGVNLISGDSADRTFFSSPRAAAYCAGMGYSSHPFMQPNQPFAQANAYIQPLWDLWRALGERPVRVFNDAIGAPVPASRSHDALHTVVYQTATGKSLLVAANLSDAPVHARLEVDPSALGLPASAPISPVPAKGTAVAKVKGKIVDFGEMGAYGFGGAVIGT